MAKLSRMPLTFAEFKKDCEAHGYHGAIDQTTYASGPQLIFTIRTKNNVKAEVKPASYTLGNGRSEEELLLLRDELSAKGYVLTKINVKRYFSIDFKKGEDVMTRFWQIVADVESIEGIEGTQRGTVRKVFTREENDASRFEKIAKRYKFAIEVQDQDMLDLGRTLLSADSMDELITLGQSKQGNADSYREHLVPCIMIHNQAIDMTLAGSSIAEVAQMIKANLAILRISDEEQVLLDITLGLRTTMPEGWKFGDSIFARLNAAKIEF